MNNNYFKPAGNLESVPTKTSKTYFKPAGNLESESSKKTTTEEVIKDYLLSIVSGKKCAAECELGTLKCAGGMIVNFEKLQKMVNSGKINIVKAEYINDNMIFIEFQEFEKEDTKGMRR